MSTTTDIPVGAFVDYRVPSAVPFDVEFAVRDIRAVIAFTLAVDPTAPTALYINPRERRVVAVPQFNQGDAILQANAAANNNNNNNNYNNYNNYNNHKPIGQACAAHAPAVCAAGAGGHKVKAGGRREGVETVPGRGGPD